MSEFTFEDMLDEIAKDMSYPIIDRAGGEFTVDDICSRAGHLARRTVQGRLKRKVENGELTVRRVYDPDTQHWMNAYKKAKPEG